MSRALRPAIERLADSRRHSYSAIWATTGRPICRARTATTSVDRARWQSDSGGVNRCVCSVLALVALWLAPDAITLT
jgi:hypothetical protein